MKRIDNLEFRYSGTNEKYELVRWIDSDPKEYCIVIAFFNKESEGCSIEFIGGRPFDTGNKELVWSMLSYGQSIVDAEYELEYETKHQNR